MDILQPYRDKIDALDDQIIDLLAARFQIIYEVADIKSKEGIPAVLQDRVDQVRERCAARGRSKNIDPDLIRKLYTDIIDKSCAIEEEILNDPARKQG